MKRSPNILVLNGKVTNILRQGRWARISVYEPVRLVSTEDPSTCWALVIHPWSVPTLPSSTLGVRPSQECPLCLCVLCGGGGGVVVAYVGLRTFSCNSWSVCATLINFSRSWLFMFSMFSAKIDRPFACSTTPAPSVRTGLPATTVGLFP